MSILYDLIEVKDLSHLTEDQRKDFLCEIITNGNFKYLQKFKGLVDKEIPELFDSDRILELLPLNIDFEMFEYILTNYKFKQGQHFFYNYAINQDNYKIRAFVYNYFVENFSHIMFDNMDMYESLLEK